MSDQVPEIGKHGEYEPRRCAVTGQWVRGRHATTYSLGDGFYFRVLVKAKHLANIEKMRETLQAVLPGKPSKKTAAKSEVK